MRQSKLLIPTLRETPAEAEVVSHQLMLRAGYIRKLAAGIYSFLTLGLRVLQKIENIIREEMEVSGAQEVLLPVVMPAELWKETGRWEFYGKELLRFKDRGDREFCLGPTHEEAITDLIRQNVNSYRQLPLNLYQIQTKFRDEIRPRFGLMRGREFIMKDGYSFDADEAGARETYQEMFDAYNRIFKRCGLKFRPVEAMTGAIGGSLSHEFQVLAKSGEDPVLTCTQCDYAANVEKAQVRKDFDEKNLPQGSGKFQKVSTPDLTTVDEVAEFLKIPQERVAKILIFDSEQGPIAALLRGDHELVEAKLQAAAGVGKLEKAGKATIEGTLRSALGYTGPIGLKAPLYVDYALAGMEDFVTGAGEAGFHFTGVNLGDFSAKGIFDLRRVWAGDPCPRCEAGKYEEHRGIEVGQVFFLGTKYSQSMQAVYKDEKGEEQLLVMGCFGIGVSRTAAAAIEQNHDGNGIIWPYPLAPYHFHLVSLNLADEQVAKASQEIYEKARMAALEVLWDDRDESPGVKFKDSDLLGIPYRVVVGSKGLKEGMIEVKSRASGEMQKIPVDQIIDYLIDLDAAAQALN